MSAGCETEGCTVGDTGKCVLDNDPNTCEFRARVDDPPSISSEPDYVRPVLESPVEKPTLWGSLPLDLDELRDLMVLRQCLLVGIVGTPAAGKTAALVSMYLLLSHGNLEGFQFADSKSLMAFEEISQGARRWGPSPPDEMTARTETSGGRVAGFLHARLKRLSDGNLVDLLVPDLPGEWSDTLIDGNRTNRLDFLRSADAIWVFVNGAELRDSTFRMHTLNRTKLLLRRVTDMLGTRKPPIKIVVSHADAGDLSGSTASKLTKMGDDLGVDVEIIDIASFSDVEGTAPGTGIPGLIDASLTSSLSQPPEWPETTFEAERFMLRYKGTARQ